MHRTKLITTLAIPLAFFLNCAKLGEASVSLSAQNVVPAQNFAPGTNKPGMGSAGGPANYSFWVKNRQATADVMVGSFTPFYKVDATRLAVSANFVLYRDSLLSGMSASQAATVLATMETAYTNLKTVYGAGQQPSANNNARIVILAYDILDDYSTTGNYVGGYFSPRDLYSNTFTNALYTDPVAQQQYYSIVATVGGHSNEMSIVYYDLSPGYSLKPQQVNDTVVHELSHLFTYNRRVIKDRLVIHDLWITEGIAENAPHQTVQNANVQQLRLEQLASPSTIDYFQDAPQLTDFATWAPKVVGYIQSNLFFNYLRHRAELNATGSAATMLTELMTTSDQTITGLETVIAKYIPGNNFSSIYGDYVLTNYVMFLGIPINQLNGTAMTAARFSFDNVQIGHSGQTVNGTSIKSKYPADLAYNYEAPKCADGTAGLKPNSYIVFRHLVGSPSTTITPTDNAPADQLKLKYVVNLTTDLNLINATPPSLNFRSFDAGTAVDLTAAPYSFALNDYIQVIVYNPNKSGNCLAFDANLIGKRNHSKWTSALGPGTQASPDLEWQSDSGAAWNNSTNGAYYRPDGIAAFAGWANGTTSDNHLYIVDYTNMSLQRINADSGTPLGRVGNTSTVCPTTGSGWDMGSSRYANNHCAHSFDSPRGVHVDAVRPRNGNTTNASTTISGISVNTAGITAGMCVSGANITTGAKVNSVVDGTTITLTIAATGTGTSAISIGCVYVADSNNRRIVQYDMDGNFIAWLGASGLGWQTAGTVVSGMALTGSLTDTTMFHLPWTLTTDGTFIYVVDYGAHRISKRNKVSGAFQEYIGNGENAWNNGVTDSGAFGTGDGNFQYPRGIAADATYLYIADELNNRVVRVNKTSGAFANSLGNGNATWTSLATATGSSQNKHFKNPSGVAIGGNFLYIADRQNNRIVKWKLSGTCTEVSPAAPDAYCGWIGHGKLRWERAQDAPSSDPYAGFSYYPPDYYAEPHALSISLASARNTKNDYIYYTALYNGRVGRINIGCVDNPISINCSPSYNPFAP